MHFRSPLPLVLVTFLPLFCTGCIIVSASKSTPPPPPVCRPTPTSEGVIVATEDESLVLTEIQAALKLDFENNRLVALKNIAQRPALCPCAQVQLVDAAYGRLDFENSKIALLQSLIANPSFSIHAKKRILEGIDHLAFENNRSHILDLLNQQSASR